MAYIITHPTDGVFVGTGLGMAFFTNLDCAGQQQVCTFKDAQEAQSFIDEVLSKGYDPKVLGCAEVDTDKAYATPEVLSEAGFKDAADALRTEVLAAMDTTAGFQM